MKSIGTFLRGQFNFGCSIVPDAAGAVPPVGQRVPVDAAGHAVGLFEELSSVFHAVRVAVANFLDLVSMEARRAVQSIAWMAACALIAGVCVVAAWLGLMAALAMWVVSQGASLLVTVIGIAIANAVVAILLVYACIGLSRNLTFPATRRQIAEEATARSPRENASA